MPFHKNQKQNDDEYNHSPVMDYKHSLSEFFGDQSTCTEGWNAPISSQESDTEIVEHIDLFEDILHPEMMDALNTLDQLTNEECVLTRELKQKCQRTASKRGNQDAEAIIALGMELEMRKKEKEKALATLKRIDAQRSENVEQLISQMQRICSENNSLRLQAKTITTKQTMRSLHPLDVYDWVVDISLLQDLGKKGWEVTFSDKFFNASSKAEQKHALTMDEHNWEGAVVSVVGLYDKGKTFVLNEISSSNFPSGKKVSTKGLSFKHVKIDHTQFIILDSAGSYSPVTVSNELSVAQKEATEQFLLDLIFDLSDYFICVVNDFTSLDQRYLDKLTRSLQNSNKVFREVIVIHNFKEVHTRTTMEHIWKNQVTNIYAGGKKMKTKVAAISEHGRLKQQYVKWFKTPFSRHICLTNANSRLGKKTNPWAFSLLTYWLKSVFVPVNRNFSVVKEVIQYSSKKLSAYFRNDVNLSLQPGPDERAFFIRPDHTGKKMKFRLPEMRLDASGLMLTSPDSFIPAYDIVFDKDVYGIYMDIPGLSAKDITLKRQNVMTIIKGKKVLPYNTTGTGTIKRKSGVFVQSFTIPHQFERKFSKCVVNDGVLTIIFRRDSDSVECTALDDIKIRKKKKKK